MDDRHEFFCLIAIQRLFCCNPVIGCALIKEEGGAAAIFRGGRERLKHFFGRHDALWEKFRDFDDWRGVERDAGIISKSGATLIGLMDDRYPALLGEIHDPPPVIAVRGRAPELLAAPSVAIVGSRKASDHNRGIAASLARELSLLGFSVVSGLAWGIDAAAHRGALSGSGSTVAVKGCGIDIAYPPSNVELERGIADTGLLVSEFPAGELPYASNFPQRNRIISGLSLATVVVEATEKSGSLITARFALEQGRDVMAVPGLAGSLDACGTHRLIRDGALLVESAEEVAEALARYLPAGVSPEKTGHLQGDVDKDSALLTSLRGMMKGATVDELICWTGLAAQDALCGLSRLVVAGAVEELPGRRFRLKRS